MNKHDIPFLIKDINNKMPVHNLESGIIPDFSYGQNFPKNLEIFRAEKMNKFLNKHQSDIEELKHKKNLPYKLETFLKKQFTQHIKYGIFNHDSFLSNLKNDFLYGHKSHILGCGFLINSFVFTGPANGANIESGSSSATSSGWGTNNMRYSKANTLGTIGQLYDRIGYNLFSAVGNITQACYSDNGSNTPLTKLAQTATSITTVTGYPWNSVTEFSLTTAQVWIANAVSSGSINWYYFAGSSGDQQVDSGGYNAGSTLPATASIGNPNNTEKQNQRIGHS